MLGDICHPSFPLPTTQAHTVETSLALIHSRIYHISLQTNQVTIAYFSNEAHGQHPLFTGRHSPYIDAMPSSSFDPLPPPTPLVLQVLLLSSCLWFGYD